MNPRVFPLLLTACAFSAVSPALRASDELYRPQFHFSPKQNWMNDPNGLVYYDGEYHLFFQYNPYGINWGNMSWGHAVSTDLVRWQELPVAIPTSDGIAIFSGSAVVDWNNTSGFGIDGKPPMVAIYTGASNVQDQRIAYSNDHGRTWTKYAGNPVININAADFRDPKVSWDAARQRWLMVVALSGDRKVRFYSSPDLKNWSLLSEFGPAGALGIWECPDFFPLKVTGESTTKWVLSVNTGGSGPAGGTGNQYFIGEFDGTTFTNDDGSPAAENLPAGTLIADFEGGSYGTWTRTGTAFGAAPAAGTLASQQAVTGYLGFGLVNTFLNGDGTTGTLTSASFQITKSFINFLIGGGNHPGQTCINLRVNGQTVRTATGGDDERLNWKNWDVTDLIGQNATIQIVDSATGGWGHVNIDHILMADSAIVPRSENVHWVERGPDSYAAVSWSDIPASDGRRLWLGWMTNGDYAGSTPTSPWRSNMTLPRELQLHRMADGLHLAQIPIAELASARGARLSYAGGTVDEAAAWLATQSIPKLFEAVVDLQVPEGKSATLRIGNDTEKTLVTWDRSTGQVSVDRTQSGNVSFSGAFPAVHSAPVLTTGDHLKLHLFLDAASLEVFSDDGTVAISSLIFPSATTKGLSVMGSADARIASLDLWEMKSALPAGPAAGTPLAAWSFDQAANGGYADTTGNGHDLIIDPTMPSPNVVTGVEGGAVEMRANASGQISALKAPSSASLMADSFTVSYFFNPKANDGNKLFQLRWEGSNGLAWGTELLNNRTLNFYVFNNQGAAIDVQTAAALPSEAYDLSNRTADNNDNDPTWHHCAASYDAATGRITLYLDGVKATTVISGFSGSPRYGTTGIGGIQTGNGMTIYDDLRIYSGVLSDADVESLRQHPGQSLPSQPGGGTEPDGLKVFRAGSSTFFSWPSAGASLYRSEDMLNWTHVEGSETMTTYGTVTSWKPNLFFKLTRP